MNWLEQVVRVGCLTGLVVCTACNLPASQESSPSCRARAASPSIAAEVRAPAALVTKSAPPAVAAAVTVTSLPTVKATSKHADESGVKLKRLVVATGVKDREPLVTNDALPSDGSAIYAFAELTNPAGGSENVRITFERKGGAERVGDVTLPVPANVSRHRTWAFTRFIRAPGVWEAVLWSESGSELGRTSFEVKAS
jgi:hypothetical protein